MPCVWTVLMTFFRRFFPIKCKKLTHFTADWFSRMETGGVCLCSGCAFVAIFCVYRYTSVAVGHYFPHQDQIDDSSSMPILISVTCSKVNCLQHCLLFHFKQPQPTCGNSFTYVWGLTPIFISLITFRT